MNDQACKSRSGYCNRQLTKNEAHKYRNIEIQVLNKSKSIFNTKFMLIVKLDYGFRLNLYLWFDIYVVYFDI